MKKILFLIILFFTLNSSAQTLKEFLIEPSPEAIGSVYSSSCGSPTNGVLVFKSAIAGLRISMYPPSKLYNINDNRDRNEYVLCVEPTSGRYQITISHPEYETTVFFVEDVFSSQAQLYRVNPKQSGSLSATATELIELGDNRLKSNQFAEAEAYYRRALSEAPDNAALLYKLGETCLKQGKNSEAADFLQKSIAIRPSDVQSHFMLGGIYYELGRYVDAANRYRTAVDLAPNNSSYRNELQKALNANPNKAKANAEMGDIEQAQGNYTEALKFYNEAAKADPQNSIYQTKIRNVGIYLRQQEYMTTAANAFAIAQKTIRPTSGSMSNIVMTNITLLQPYLDLYKKPLDEVAKAKALGPLPQNIQETADYYEFEYQWQYYDGDVSAAWLQEFLNKHPNTPLRPLIDMRKKTVTKVFRTAVWTGFAYNNFMVFNLGAGLRIFGCESPVNLYVGLQYGYFFTDYYDRSNGNTKPENNDSWNINVNQISLPVTLQLNIVRLGTMKRSVVFVSATGQVNYNINATCFKEKQKDFVEPIGYSGIASIGYGGNKWALSVFCRKDFSSLFKRDKLFEFDNHDSNNNYSFLDKAIDTNLYFGLTLGAYF